MTAAAAGSAGPPLAGSWHEVETPALVIDAGVLERNLDDVARRIVAAGKRLVPHTKTHKLPPIAAMQLARGAAGLTAATLREGEALADVGAPFVLLAYPPVGRRRLERIVALARRVPLRVSLDDVEVLEVLDRTCREAGVSVGWMWEVEAGAGRIGSPAGAEAARNVVRALQVARTCPFAGLLAFAGHAYGANSTAEVERVAEMEVDALATTQAALAAAGVEVPALSAGSTPTWRFHVRDEGAWSPVTELRPGNYVFHDATQLRLGTVGPEACALSVLATVVARPAPDRVILDAGSKALSAERLDTGLGYVQGAPDWRIDHAYEEHAIVLSPRAETIPVGARVRVVPNHACPCVNLHAGARIARDGELTDEIWPVVARGWEADA